MEDRRITYFAETNLGRQVRFGIRDHDRDKHMYIIGKTGMGKSTMLENMVVQDIQAGESVIFIDPHGASAERILDHIPEERINDVLYFAPHDIERPVAFNIIDEVDPDKRRIIVEGMVRMFERLWVDPWNSKVGYILQNALLAIVEDKDATLLDVSRLFNDETFRKQVADYVQDPVPRAFLREEFPTYTDEFVREVSQTITNNIERFTTNPVIKNIINHPDSSFKVRDMIDQRKIIIANLAKGRIGEENARFLGSSLLTRVYHAVTDRARMHEIELEHAPMANLYVDEFQSFSNRSFVDMFSEARKYKLALTIAHQYTGQMKSEVRDAILGNVGTLVSFSVSAEDGRFLEHEFAPVFNATDLSSLGLGNIYLKLMIDGRTSEPFSAVTLPPIQVPKVSHRDRVIAASRKQFSVAPGEQFRLPQNR